MSDTSKTTIKQIVQQQIRALCIYTGQVSQQ